MRLEILQGDITTRDVDAIVNAANSSLMGGGEWTARSIAPRAGSSWPRAWRCANGTRTGCPWAKPWLPRVQIACPMGDPHRWPNRHAGQNDPELLSSCFRESLKVAASLGASSVAFPAISAGVYGWDAREVAAVALDAVSRLDVESSSGLELVEFVLFSAETTDVFRSVFGASDG